MFKGNKSKFLILLVVLSLLVALVPAGVAGAASTKCDVTYTVKRGDTLTSVANKYSLDAKSVVQASKLGKPYTIYVGQKLCIPDNKDKDAPKIDDKYTKVPAAYFTAGRSGNNVVIYTYTYPKTTVLAKAGPAASTTSGYTKLGTASVQPNKAYKFELPDKLKNARNLRVCLKDRTTSYLQCVNLP
jgi:LysM repeat protein